MNRTPRVCCKTYIATYCMCQRKKFEDPFFFMDLGPRMRFAGSEVRFSCSVARPPNDFREIAHRFSMLTQVPSDAIRRAPMAAEFAPIAGALR